MMGDLPDAVAALLLDYELSEEERDSINPFELLDLEFPIERPCPVWRAHRHVLLPFFVRRHPGRRPSRWWRYDAPRRPAGRFGDGPHELPRMRLGGVGTAAMDVFAVEPRCHLGIPVEWIRTAEEIAWCRAEGIEAVPAIDPADPPAYEAQAAYLRRYGLFQRGEERRLPPDAFEPEQVYADAEGDVV